MRDTAQRAEGPARWALPSRGPRVVLVLVQAGTPRTTDLLCGLVVYLTQVYVFVMYGTNAFKVEVRRRCY